MTPPVSVVIPARNEADTVGAVVAAASGLAMVQEVIVVDDASSDATAAVAAAAGARIVHAADVLPGVADGPGKGQALWKGVAAASGELIVFLDADLVDFDADYVTRLAGALMADPRAALVKPAYERAGEGGRVTELTAKPAIELLFPELAHIRQPLGGEYAAWRDMLIRLPFVHGYGVDLALIIDIADRFGSDAIGQVELSPRRHRSRPLNALAPQARTVLEVAFARAGLAMKLDECPPLATYLRRTA